MVDTASRMHLDAEVDEYLDVATGGRTAVVDVPLLTDVLLGRWRDAKLAAREYTKRPELHKIEGMPYAEHRERVLEQLKVLADLGASKRAFPEYVGGGNDHGGNLAAFEELITADPSVAIKGGVQWGLFGAAILHLGTRPHHEQWLPDAMSLAVPGAFAMTEIGHGSDVASIGTTATYDVKKKEFFIHTPFRAATKEFLGNAALHAQAAVVFAQLITQGVNHGVHAFYVPVRGTSTGLSTSTSTRLSTSADGQFLPGITGQDDGYKGGLNGVDNGRLAFDSVRVPRENLLNKYGDVVEDGTYASPIDSPGRRFFTMIGTLVQGRVSLAGSAALAASLGLTIAVTYGNQRRQFTAGSDTDEVVLLDYQRHQRRLITRLAETYAHSFAHEELLQKFDDVFSGKADTDDDRQDLETLAAALKPLATWSALDTLQEAREACGGAGFMAENRLTGLRADLDVWVTFEGDNTVLLQLVAKRLLTDYSAKFKNADTGALARYVVGMAADRAYHGTGLRTLAQTIRDFGSTARSVAELRETNVQRELLTDRVETMIEELGQRLRPASKLSKQDAADLFNSVQNELIEAALAHAELLSWEAFTRGVEKIEDPGTRQVMDWLHDVYGLGLIEKHLSWYLIHGRLNPQRAQVITAYIDRLLARLRPHAQDLVDAFGFEPEHVRAPIASGIEAERQEEARAYYRDLWASGSAPAEEKALRAALEKHDDDFEAADD